MQRKTYMEKLGLETVTRLNKTICLRRVRFLRKNIREGIYRGKLLERAQYYRNWYAWFAKQDCIRPAS